MQLHFCVPLATPPTCTLLVLGFADKYCNLGAVGRLSKRVEAFLVGSAMSELSHALQQAGSLDLVASASAWSLVKDKCTGQALGHGCALVHECDNPWLNRINSNSSSSSSATQNHDSTEDLQTCSCRTLKDMLRTTPGTQCRLREGGSMKSDHENARCYLPSFVVQMVEAGMAAGRLAEHRFVSILFLVHQARRPCVPPPTTRNTCNVYDMLI